eukprot:scaffold4498_cov243-Chaetoceros_neogracile.AAC.1
MTNVRVNINGQFGVNNPFSAFNSEEVTIDRTLASSDAAPRNWSSFCTDADKALEDVTKVKASYRIFGPLNLICNIGSFVAIVWYFLNRSSISSSSTIVLYVVIALTVPKLFITIVTNKRVNAGMAKLEVVCQDHSGNGSRYVLCNEPTRQRSTNYFGKRSAHYFVTVMNYDTEGQQQEQAVGTAVVNTATESVPGSPWNTNPTPSSTFQPTPNLASSSGTYVAPQPSAPSTNPYLQAAPAPAPAPTTGNSIFDQLSK